MRKPRALQKPASELPPAEPQPPKRLKRAPEFDIALGARIRAARVAAGINQTVLGEAVGVSYQQMQKYETGKDRVAASTLQSIAGALGVHPGSFFDQDAPLPDPSSKPRPRSTVADLRNSQRIGERIERLDDPALVRRLMALVDVMLEVKSGAAAGDADVPGGEKL